MIPIRMELSTDDNITLKQWRIISRDTWEDVGEFWHSRLLRKHFRHSAKAEYGYKTRSNKFERRKRKKFGHNRPLEFTGRMKRQLMRMANVKGSSNTSTKQGGVKVRLSGPVYFTRFRKRANQPDKAAEIQAVSAADARLMAQLMDKQITKRIDAKGRKRKVPR